MVRIYSKNFNTWADPVPKEIEGNKQWMNCGHRKSPCHPNFMDSKSSSSSLYFFYFSIFLFLYNELILQIQRSTLLLLHYLYSPRFPLPIRSHHTESLLLQSTLSLARLLHFLPFSSRQFKGQPPFSALSFNSIFLICCLDLFLSFSIHYWSLICSNPLFWFDRNFEFIGGCLMLLFYLEICFPKFCCGRRLLINLMAFRFVSSGYFLFDRYRLCLWSELWNALDISLF